VGVGGNMYSGEVRLLGSQETVTAQQSKARCCMYVCMYVCVCVYAHATLVQGYLLYV
jgi:hypothetical protein